MTIIIEVSAPFQKRFGRFETDLMTRWFWLWFAIAVLKVPFRQFCETPQVWIGGELEGRS